jgi:hypothetical protein
LAYNEVNLAPRDLLAELVEIGEMLVGGGPVLMTEYQPYGVRHFLRSSEAEGASELRRRLVPLADGSSLEKGLWADTDDFRADAFKPYEALVLRRSPEQSRPPGDFKLKKAGEFYEVWLRDAGVTSATEWLPLGSGRSPVSVPECADVRELARSVPGGTLLAAESGEPLFLDGPAGEVEVEGGSHTVWLEGSIRGEATLEIDGEEVGTIRHFLNNEGLYAELASADVSAGPHEISVTVEGGDLAPGSGGTSDYGVLAVGPETQATLRAVSASDFRELCGKTLDWIEARP